MSVFFPGNIIKTGEDKHMWIEKTIDRGSQDKLYVQLGALLREKIEMEEWPVNTQIPTEDDLCFTYGVSKATVRIAVSELVREGYLRRQQGKGTFVDYAAPNLGIDMKTRLAEEMFGEGVKVERQILMRGPKRPSEDVRKYLGTDDTVHYVLCKRMAGGKTAYLEELFLPLFILPGVETEDICQPSFYELIRRRSIRKIAKVIQTVEVTEVGAEAAEILKVPAGSAALLLHRLFVGANNDPIAYTRLMGSGRAYKIQTVFERIR